MASAPACAWTPRPAPPSSSAQPKAAPPKSSATSPPHYKAADPARLPHPPTRRRSRSGHERRHRSQDPDRDLAVITVESRSLASCGHEATLVLILCNRFLREATMLLNLDPVLIGQLLMALDEMGHGDAVVIADAHFTASP